jgi:acetyl-CoA/propionyl-CoA carboxylase biotin carboxyl carrier protein
VHTRWIETEFGNTIPAWEGTGAGPQEPQPRERVVVEVDGRRLQVSLPAGLAGGHSAGTAKKAPRRSGTGSGGAAASGDSLTSPMQGTIVKIAVEEGQIIAAGDLVVVLEAMKMEQPISAHKAGTVTRLNADVGQTVISGAVICELKA